MFYFCKIEILGIVITINALHNSVSLTVWRPCLTILPIIRALSTMEGEREQTLIPAGPKKSAAASVIPMTAASKCSAYISRSHLKGIGNSMSCSSLLVGPYESTLPYGFAATEAKLTMMPLSSSTRRDSFSSASGYWLWIASLTTASTMKVPKDRRAQTDEVDVNRDSTGTSVKSNSIYL